jgi:hypothetical protein
VNDIDRAGDSSIWTLNNTSLQSIVSKRPTVLARGHGDVVRPAALSLALQTRRWVFAGGGSEGSPRRAGLKSGSCAPGTRTSFVVTRLEL